MIDLARAREIRDLIAARNPPPGWPTHIFASVIDGERMIVPKCSMIECCEPGTIHVSFRSLVAVTSSSVYSCPEHVEHFAAAGLKWVTPCV